MKKIIQIFITILLCLLFTFTNNIFLILLSILINTLYLIKNKDFNKYIRILFFTYIFILIYLTLLSPFYGRGTLSFNFNKELYLNYFTNECNFIPFKTISFYVSNLFNFSDKLPLNTIIINLLGNIICLIPFAVFIPYFSKKFNHPLKFSLVIIGITLTIEIIQLITMAGAFDVDDIILNALGCIIFYLVFNKEINRFYNTFKFATNKKEWHIFIGKIVILIIICLSLLIAFIILKKEEHKFFFYKLSLINYQSTCQNKEETLIYQNELYNYYIECQNPNYIEIDINNKTYKLSDYLNNKTKYLIDLNKLENSGIKLRKEERWEKITICPNNSSSPISYDDSNIIKLYYYGQENKCFALYMIPQNVGEDNITFTFDSEKITYNFKVENNFNVTATLVE